MEGGKNMIRRLNAAIWNYLKKIKLRSVGATILGGFAGLSLVSSIIPSVMSFMGIMDHFSVRWAMGGYAVYAVMSWSVGGWAVHKSGCRKFGAIILGFVGLLSGLLLTGIAIGTQLKVLFLGGGAALLYGAVGGMILADALREPAKPAGGNTTDRGSKDYPAPPTSRQ